jgi:hypothetical protein
MVYTTICFEIEIQFRAPNYPQRLLMAQKKAALRTPKSSRAGGL